MVIFCQNKRIENGKEHVVCNRYLLDLPQCLIDALRKNPGEKIRFRCATCPTYDRWPVMYADSEGKIIWESSGEKPDFDSKLKFDEVIVTEQVA